MIPEVDSRQLKVEREEKKYRPLAGEGAAIGRLTVLSDLKSGAGTPHSI
jgi:hypothetical protein